MVKSMTGFGKVSESFDKFDITVEIKSVNSKYFDPFFRIPRLVSSAELDMRSFIQEKLIRGKVEVRVEVAAKTAVNDPVLNKELFAKYKEIITAIKDGAGIEEEPKIEHFLHMPDIIEFRADATAEEELHKNLMQAVSDCVARLDEMRIAEGTALETDIEKRIDNLRGIISGIDASKAGVFEYWAEKFKKRITEMGVLGGYDERIIQEAALYGEKADITEEITRLRSHLEQFLKILKIEYPAGKKLDFLSQEIHREFNTIASKSSKASIISAVVEAKAEADRIREQVQNIV